MRKYLIENVSEAMIHYKGYALGRAIRKRPGGSLWLEEEDFNSDSIQSMISSNRLRLVKAIPPLEPKVVEEIPSPSIPVEEPKEEVVEEVVIVEEAPQAEEAAPAAEGTQETEAIDYSSMKTSELRQLLKDRGLYESSIRKKADMIKVLEESDED